MMHTKEYRQPRCPHGWVDVTQCESCKAAAERDALQKEVDRLRGAICQTLDANGHLADGEVCTLLSLKVAPRESGAPWAGEELNAELRGAKPIGEASRSNDVLCGVGDKSDGVESV